MAEEKESTMTLLTPEQTSEAFKGADISQLAREVAERQQAEVAEKKEEIIEGDEVNEVADQKKVEEVAAEEPQPFNLEFFNKQFSTEFKDEDSIKATLESVKKIADLEKQAAEIPSLKEEIEFLRAETDPMKYFPSEDDFRVAQFKRQFPDKDPGMVAKLFSMDLSQAKDFDVIAWSMMLDNPDLDGGEVGAREFVADKYGIEDPNDLSELSSLTKNQLKVNARQDRARITQMKADIVLPEKKDYSSLLAEKKQTAEAQEAELRTSWSTITEKMVSEFPDIVINETDKDGKITEVFKYAVGKDLSNEMVAPLVDSLVKSGIPIDEKAVRILGNAIQKEYVHTNFDKIVKLAIKNATATLEEKVLEEEHNPSPPNEKERKVGDSKDLTSKILQDLKSGAGSAKRAH